MFLLSWTLERVSLSLSADDNEKCHLSFLQSCSLFGKGEYKCDTTNKQVGPMPQIEGYNRTHPKQLTYKFIQTNCPDGPLGRAFSERR
jgi:hypothetical protein